MEFELWYVKWFKRRVNRDFVQSSIGSQSEEKFVQAMEEAYEAGMKAEREDYSKALYTAYEH